MILQPSISAGLLAKEEPKKQGTKTPPPSQSTPKIPSSASPCHAARPRSEAGDRTQPLFQISDKRQHQQSGNGDAARRNAVNVRVVARRNQSRDRLFSPIVTRWKKMRREEKRSEE